MKKIFRNSRFIAIAFATLLSVCNTVLLANDSTLNPIVPVEFKLIGNVQSNPIFQLSYAGNTEQDVFTVSIIDAEGTSLYKETIKGENFSKKFMLNKDEIVDGNLRFELYSKKHNKTVVYEVNRSTRQIEELVIVKL